METKAKEIRYQSQQRHVRRENLMYLVNEESLLEQHKKQKRRKEAGTDGVVKDEYDVNHGGLISPICANVYLHYVLDLWFQKKIKLRMRGEAYYLRYADDFVILFQYESDAKAVKNLLKERLAKFSLELSEEKTRILPIGRFKGNEDRFDFLGFTFFNTKNKNGKYRLGIISSKKKLKAKR